MLCKLEDFNFVSNVKILRFVWEVSEHVCLAFAFVVLLPCDAAKCSSTQGLRFEYVHGVNMDTCPDSHPVYSSEAATKQLFDLLRLALHNANMYNLLPGRKFDKRLYNYNK